jgi:hypothetical protein
LKQSSQSNDIIVDYLGTDTADVKSRERIIWYSRRGGPFAPVVSCTTKATFSRWNADMDMDV